MFRFIHSADLHLGKPFGRFPEEVRARLRLAREGLPGQLDGLIGRLAAVARTAGAGHVLLAGDTFDAQTPTPRIVRQTLGAIAAAPDVVFVLLPGNHDSLAAGELWGRLQTGGPANLLLALEPVPVPLAPGVMLLPAPCTARRPGLDLTEAMGQPTPEGALRIGLGHGAVTDFSAGGEEGAPAVIPPDRAARAGLEYLALGDWHGQMQIGPRTWYAGTPEPDSHRHAAPGCALAVTLAGPGALPLATAVPTAVLRWVARTLDLLPDDAGPGLLDAALPPAAAREATVLRMTLTGRAHLADHRALRARLAAAEPDFLSCEIEDRVRPEVTAEDLDLIDRAGALRDAADLLAAEAAEPAQTPQARADAEGALRRLFALSGGSAS